MFTTKGYGLSKTSGAIQFIVPGNKTINFKKQSGNYYSSTALLLVTGLQGQSVQYTVLYQRISHFSRSSESDNLKDKTMRLLTLTRFSLNMAMQWQILPSWLGKATQIRGHPWNNHFLGTLTLWASFLMSIGSKAHDWKRKRKGGQEIMEWSEDYSSRQRKGGNALWRPCFQSR